MGAFQNNVRRTFDVVRFAKRASIVALAATFFTSIAIGRSSDPYIAYLLFFFAVILAAEIHTRKSGYDVVDHPSLSLHKFFKPLLLAVPVVIAIYTVLLFTFRWDYTPGTTESKLWPAFFAAAIVGFTEEFARFVWLQILPYSVLSANLLWVLLHPQIAIAFAGGVPDFRFAIFALIFGGIMSWVMWAYESRRLGRLSEYMGPAAAMVYHAGFNVLVVAFAVQIFGISFGVM